MCHRIHHKFGTTLCDYSTACFATWGKVWCFPCTESVKSGFCCWGGTWITPSMPMGSISHIPLMALYKFKLVSLVSWQQERKRALTDWRKWCHATGKRHTSALNGGMNNCLFDKAIVQGEIQPKWMVGLLFDSTAIKKCRAVGLPGISHLRNDGRDHVSYFWAVCTASFRTVTSDSL